MTEETQTMEPQTQEDNALKELVKKAKELRDLRERIAEQETDVKELKKQELILSRETIPDMLLEEGLQTFETDEFKVSSRVKYQGSITKSQDQQHAIDLLVKHGFGAAVKVELKIAQGLDDKGHSDLLIVAKHILDKFDIPYDTACTIHASTLKSAIKELLEDGTDVNVEDIEKTFGVFQYTETEIKGK